MLPWFYRLHFKGVLCISIFHLEYGAVQVNARGLDELSPCLVVRLLPALEEMTVYLNCMTASVPLLGICPGSVVQLGDIAVTRSTQSNRYASATPSTSLAILSQGEALQISRRQD